MGTSHRAALLGLLLDHDRPLDLNLPPPPSPHSTRPTSALPSCLLESATGKATPRPPAPATYSSSGAGPEAQPLHNHSSQLPILPASYLLSPFSDSSRWTQQSTALIPPPVICSPSSPLVPTLSNVNEDVHNSTTIRKQRFEMYLNATDSGVVPTPANISNREQPCSTSRADPVVRTAAINIPGFDPTRYGKPEVSSKVEVAPISSPSLPANVDIHSSTPTHSTLDYSTLATTPQEPPTFIKYQTALSSVNLRASIEAAASQQASGETQVASSHAQMQLRDKSISTFPPASHLHNQSQVIIKLSSSPPALARPLQPHTQGRLIEPLKPVSTNNMSSTPQPHRQNLYQQPTSVTPSSGETPQEKLARLQMNSLNTIRRRNRRQDRDDTASPATLSALRLPMSPDKEQKVADRVSHYQNLSNFSLQPQASGSGIATSDTPASRWSRQSPNDPLTPRGPTLNVSQNEMISDSPKIPTRPKAHLSGQSSDYYVPPHAKPPPAKQNSRWVSNAEIKPEEVSEDSNAWGSVDADAFAANSGDSVEAIHHGDLPRARALKTAEDTLRGWDGRMQPPPVDWADRPRFDNNNTDFREAFNIWGEAIYEKALLDSSQHPFDCINMEKIHDPSFHADGIAMVPRNMTINKTNAVYYGYSWVNHESIRDSQPLTHEELTQITSIDTADPANEPILNETTEIVVQRWLAHHNIDFESISRKASSEQKVPALQKKQAAGVQSAPHPQSPSVAIYLRPAVVSDVSQMTTIYNWHIENGPRTAEYGPVPEHDMRNRLEEATKAKLPFVVAVAKASRHSRRKPDDASSVRRGMNGSGAARNSNADYSGMARSEKILGWACAQDFTTTDYVERISAELEIYVASGFHRQGIGRCLLDKLLDACDRGYLKRGGYDFNCAPEQSYLYNGGGGRDLHKLYFILRTWSIPRKAKGTRNVGKIASANDVSALGQEDDYEAWMKAWLESKEFEVEGRLKQAATKNGRFLDIIHLGRVTMWQPAEGRIPDVLPGTS